MGILHQEGSAASGTAVCVRGPDPGSFSSLVMRKIVPPNPKGGRRNPARVATAARTESQGLVTVILKGIL